MQKSNLELWHRFQKFSTSYPELGMRLDISRMNFPEDWFQSMSQPVEKAFRAMADLENGAISNPDENRMVGHYWLRDSALAPSTEIRKEIEQTLHDIRTFAHGVHNGNVKGQGGTFKNCLVIGIGGSALGPQFVASALGNPATDKLRVFFFDNTDPDGMDKVIAQLGAELGRTLCIVISKSGGTKETRNGMLEAEAAFKKAGLLFSPQAVAVTGVGSELDQYATENAWLKRFPMWDWVGGRTSETSAVGLLPAALQGFDIDEFLAGARECDGATRQATINNPAVRMALMWYYAGNGRGSKDMVVLPYKDRLELFSKYLQQLIMESLGKEKDLDGRVVNQGLSVFGNKGSTDQHAYVQQLREGLANFFVTFVRVLKERAGEPLFVEPGVTSGDYLDGFYLGTREALYQKGRESLTITIDAVTPRSVGMLIALFERTVGFYAFLIHLNAYHQPGVEAGKKAAGTVIALQGKIVTFMKSSSGTTFGVPEIAAGINSPDNAETVYHICEHLSANKRLIKNESGYHYPSSQSLV
jgi:glucose-6-phosphate isomerase